MTTKKSDKVQDEDIRKKDAWEALWDFARACVDADGDIDFESFYRGGVESFEIKIKQGKKRQEPNWIRSEEHESRRNNKAT